MAPKYAELRKLSGKELERLYDERAENTYAALGWYRDELHRRMIERQSRLLGLLTGAIAILTLLNLIVVAATIFE